MKDMCELQKKASFRKFPVVFHFTPWLYAFYLLWSKIDYMPNSKKFLWNFNEMLPPNQRLQVIIVYRLFELSSDSNKGGNFAANHFCEFGQSFKQADTKHRAQIIVSRTLKQCKPFTNANQRPKHSI